MLYIAKTIYLIIHYLNLWLFHKRNAFMPRFKLGVKDHVMCYLYHHIAIGIIAGDLLPLRTISFWHLLGNGVSGFWIHVDGATEICQLYAIYKICGDLINVILIQTIRIHWSA